jgi:hypothetical protein
VAKGQIVLAVQAESTDSDRGLLRPMLDQLRRRYRRQPKRHLVDGGFNKNGDTEWAAMAGVKVYGPPMRSKHKTDPYAPRADDGPGVAAWRRRMKSPHGKGVLKRRGMGERINAGFRQWRLYQFTVPLVRFCQQHFGWTPAREGSGMNRSRVRTVQHKPPCRSLAPLSPLASKTAIGSQALRMRGI